MHDGASLEIANLVRRVMHELCMPHTALVCLFEPFELHFEEVEPFDVHDYGRLPDRVCRLDIGSSESAAQPMVDNYLVHPSEAL